MHTSLRPISLICILFLCTAQASFSQTVETLTTAFKASGGVAMGPDGTLFVADFGDNLQIASPGNNIVYKVGLDGSVTEFVRGQVGASGNAVDSEGNLYQSNIGSGIVNKISPDGTITTFSTGHRNPVGVAIAPDGQVYVANCGGAAVRRVSSTGTWANFARSSLLSCPNGLTAAPDGTLYTSNFSNGNVLKITQDGTVSILATLPGNNNGHLTYANDRLYVVDRGGHRIFEVSLEGAVKLLAGTGTRGKTDGPALESSWSIPNGIAASITGDTLFINDAVPITGNPLGVINPVVVRMITGIKGQATDRETEETPKGFGLNQNYPNPFNPMTQIPYHLAQTEHVTLTVYDVLGRPLETLVDGLQPPGAHHALFEASDAPSGIYLYRLQAGAYEETRRMVLYR